MTVPGHLPTTPLSLNHYNVQPVFDVYASVQDTDLGSVSSRVNEIIAKYKAQVSKASSIVVLGVLWTLSGRRVRLNELPNA